MAFLITDGFIFASGLDNVAKNVAVKLFTQRTIGVRAVSNCIHAENFCIAQLNDESLVFEDATADFSSITEAYFIIASDAAYATRLIEKTLTGSGITQPDATQLAVNMTSAETNLTPGNYYWEVSIVLSGGDKKTIGQGRMRVEDTGAFD